MMANILIRGVPEDVHSRLKEQAARSGQSLNEFLVARMDEMAATLTIPELIARVREREPYEGASVAELIREDRERR